jgi:hypothetical protein
VLKEFEVQKYHVFRIPWEKNISLSAKVNIYKRHTHSRIAADRNWQKTTLKVKKGS